MTQRESFDDQPSRHQPTSSENPPQLQASNFWTSDKGVLTILAIAVAATAVVIGLIVSTLDEDNEFGQPAVYTDETTDYSCGFCWVVLEGSIDDTLGAE